MSTPPIERFLPPINTFTTSVTKAYAAQGLVGLLLACMVLIGVFGFVISSDFLVATAIACIILLAFLLYLFNMYVKESTIRHALATKERIEELAAPTTLTQGNKESSIHASPSVSTLFLLTFSQVLRGSRFFSPLVIV